MTGLRPLDTRFSLSVISPVPYHSEDDTFGNDVVEVAGTIPVFLSAQSQF